MAKAKKTTAAARSLAAIDRQIVELLLERLQFGGHAQHGNVTLPAKLSEQLARYDVTVEDVTLLLRHFDSLQNRHDPLDRVAFLGPPFSYTHLATLRYYGESQRTIPVSTISAVFDAVRRGETGGGVVPIENSTDGRIVDTLSLLVRNEVKICGEVYLPIHHCLLGLGARSDVSAVYSKPQAASQCREWLARNLPDAQLIETSSTTAAAKIASETPGAAAIAAAEAGRAYNLNVIDANIEDNPHNVTRFAILGTELKKRSGNDKTTLLIQLHHEPGALADAMNVFKRAELNLTWIESFPMPQSPSEYLFFVELEGHHTDEAVETAIGKLQRRVQRVQTLGSYPRNPLK